MLVVAMLAACGGGGGDDGGGSTAASSGGGATPKAWGTATLIETDNTGGADHPQVTFDANGNALAVWEQFDGTRTNIWSNRYTAGTGWGTAALIETDNAGDAGLPKVAIDANGNALAVWHQFDGPQTSGRSNIWSNRYAASTGWGTATLIETDNAGRAVAPRIAIDANGNALAVWNQFDGTRYNIWSNRYTAGTGWGNAALIETDNAGHAQAVQIAIGANGDALAVWQQFDGTRESIWSNRYTAGTGWSTAARIENDNAEDAFSPEIAIDGSGNALVVWRQHIGTLGSIWSNRYTAGTGWGTAAIINDTAGNGSHQQIAVDARGNALAVWRQFDGGLTNIWSNRYTAGTGWGTAALNENNAVSAHNPKIAMNANGNALAVWTHNGMLWFKRYTAGTGWGTSALIENNNAGRVAENHQIAIDASGNALAVWYEWEGALSNIWVNRFQ